MTLLRDGPGTTMSDHPCFDLTGHSSACLQDDAALRTVAQALNRWDPPVQDNSWAQLYEYFYASHMALTRAYTLGYTMFRMPGSAVGGTRRAALPKAASTLWAPDNRSREVEQFLAGFYVNCALDRICSLHERLAEVPKRSESLPSIDIQLVTQPGRPRWNDATLPDSAPDQRYREVHTWVYDHRPGLLLQDFNYRKHRFDGYQRNTRENFLPVDWPALGMVISGQALLLKIGGSRASQTEYEWLEEADMTEMSPLGCLRSRCLWRLLITVLHDLSMSITVRSN